MAIKRMSMEEKRTIMMKIFQETRSFFTIKEIEKTSTKRGINEKSCKEVLQSLIDDDMVCQEKIGSSNYFWSFVKDVGKQALDEKDSLIKENRNLEKTKKSLLNKLEDEKTGREESEKRTQYIEYLGELNQKLEAQNKEMQKFSECDPRVYESKLNESCEIKKQINRVTEDIFSLQSYVVNKFNIERSVFNSNFNIDDELDYIE